MLPLALDQQRLTEAIVGLRLDAFLRTRLPCEGTFRTLF
jgi:hypothetical protein